MASIRSSSAPGRTARAGKQELLVPVVAAMKDVLAENSLITADAGYHSEENLKQLAAMQVEALIADNGMRGRDERFATQERHQGAPDPLYDKSNPQKKAATYQPNDFIPLTPRREPVCALRASRCTATAATASPTVTYPFDSKARNAIASPARIVTAAYAPPRRPRRAKSPSSRARP